MCILLSCPKYKHCINNFNRKRRYHIVFLVQKNISFLKTIFINTVYFTKKNKIILSISFFLTA